MMTTKLTFLLLGAGALGLVGVTAATIGAGPAGAASSSVVNTFVTNTSANPVPVTGAVAVSGTVAAREVDPIGGEPISVYGTFLVGCCSVSSDADVYTVPAGKILIVDDISGKSDDTGSSDHYIYLIANRARAGDTTFVGMFHGGSDRSHSFGREARYYLFPGPVTARFQRSPDDINASWQGAIFLSGRLVDDPAL